MSDRIAALESEVRVLRRELRLLHQDFDWLCRHLRVGVPGEGSDSRSPRELSVHLSGDSEDSFSVLSSRAGASSANSRRGSERVPEVAVPRTSPASSGSARSPALGPAAVPVPTTALSWAEREEIAEGIGRFIARCLQGTHRGSSGRDRNPLPSRFWLVARDFEGQIYTPVRIFRSWGSCKNLCKRFEDTGDSVFVGVPSEREARRVLQSAGLVWPGVLER